ncbi:DUF2165 domain-containing protein [Aquamicrobium sp. NLF2-7]|uniref:DUF2165 family protein n=1 Tax=Aquamicrobium sp. NLF2-7 TaxID=2918753 RepID=UPI001EFBB141|nr:DUF2165 family protein [Aquamicrobium sp. NLF2-7]MCG8273903.1 DUF2165 domain-containing protein [Aquamicrobium sp. NLF2-7]
MNAQIVGKSVLMIGLAGWMTLAVLNNIADPNTNRFHLGTMFEMTLLTGEPNGLGQDLLWRAFPRWIAPVVLWGVAIFQVAISAYLWKAAWGCAVSALRGRRTLPDDVRDTSIRALTCFMALWLCFMCGGMWFGYWIKQGAIQQVHMTLLLLSILAILFVGNRQFEGDPDSMSGHASD